MKPQKRTREEELAKRIRFFLKLFVAGLVAITFISSQAADLLNRHRGPCDMKLCTRD